jgi:hypothetical protein
MSWWTLLAVFVPCLVAWVCCLSVGDDWRDELDRWERGILSSRTLRRDAVTTSDNGLTDAEGPRPW